MLDQEGAKCDEWQLNLVASLLVGRESLPLSSSECRLQWKWCQSTGARDQPAPLSCEDSSWVSKVCIVLWAGVECPSTHELVECKGISRHTCGSNIRRRW